MNAEDLVVILDYLKHCQRIMNIDNNVGYNEGTVGELIKRVHSELANVNIEINKKE